MLGRWGSPIRRSTQTGVAEIIFQDLGDYRELLLDFAGLQHNSGTPDFLLQLSEDNGSNWITTNYIAHGAANSSGFGLSLSVPTATSIGGLVTLLNFNVAMPTWAALRCGREGSTTQARSISARQSDSKIFNALKLLNSTGTNFTANSGVTLRGR